MKPIKTIYDKRLMYLYSLANIYKEEGYVTKIDGRASILEVFPKGCILEATNVERFFSGI